MWCIRLALLHLGIGFTVGALMLAARGQALPPALLQLRPLHFELLLAGWMIQLAFGVAYWILPRLPGSARGGARLTWGAVGLLNIGVLTSGLAGVMGAPAAMVVAGRIAELVAALAFATHAWPRIRAYSPKSPSF